MVRNNNMEHKYNGIYEKFIKRPFDFFCALLAITCFFWLYIIVAIVVKVKLGSPVLFIQERPGRFDKKTGEEKIFKLYKFRTMTDECDDNGELLDDEIRLTKLGRFLRNSSLDELPEAFNILKGDMSVVGPRPLRIKYLPRYSVTQRRRHEVRPGLTGWAQVNGRNGITWQKKFEYDVEYVDNISFFGDIKIIFMTVINVLKNSSDGEGIDVEEEFLGNEVVEKVTVND